MEHTVFTDGHVRAIGFRGAVPYKIGLFPAVYLYTFQDKEHYAIGSELGMRPGYPFRSANRIRELTEKEVVTRLQDIIRVDDHVTVLCVTRQADATISAVLPDWRATHVPIQISHQPAWAFLLLPEEAEELALSTVIALQTVMDDCMLDRGGSEESAMLAEGLGWIAWGLLSVRDRRARRDTMVRIVAARSLQQRRSDLPELARIAAQSLGEPSAISVMDLASAYLNAGTVYAPKTP